MNNKILFLTLILFISIVGCKKKEDEVIINDLSIEGSWKQRGTCIYVGSSSYVTVNLEYGSNGNFSQSVETYSDSVCTARTYNQYLSGTYTTSASSKTGSGTSSYVNLDSTLATYTITPTSATVANSFNTSNFCGYNDWFVTVVKNIAGRTCGTLPIPSVGTVEYSFFEKTLSDYSIPFPGIPGLLPPSTEYYYKGDMRFGTSSTGSEGTTVDKRHQTIDGNLKYIRRQ